MYKSLWAGLLIAAIAATVVAQSRPTMTPPKTEPTTAELNAIIEYQRKQIADLTIQIDRLERRLAAASQPAESPPQKAPNRNIVTNGDFETPSAASEGYFKMIQPGQNIGAWTVALNWVDLMTPLAAQPASGTQSVDLSGASAGQIYQDLETIPGQTYELRFAMAGTGVVEQREPLVKKMQVHWGDTLVDTPTFDISDHTIKDMGWTYHTYKVTAVTPKTRLKFTSLTNSQWGPAIDNVSVVAVEAPKAPAAPARPAAAQAATQH